MHLDLLSILRSTRGEISKRLGGIIGCKDKTSSWHLIGFPDGSNIGSKAQCRGETHRYTVGTLTTLIVMQGHQQSIDKRHGR